MSALTFVSLSADTVRDVYALLQRCFPEMPPDDQYSLAELYRLARTFPEGNFVVLDDGHVVGMATGVFIDIDFDNLPATETDLLTDDDGKDVHDPAGAYYFGTDIAVDPAYRGRGIARALYERRKALVRAHNKRGIVAAAVLRGYAAYREAMSADEYVNRVVAGDLFDPTLSVQLRNGFRVVRLLKDFFIHPPSDSWSALIRWESEK